MWMCVSVLLIIPSLYVLAANVALGKPASQTEDVIWNGWTWSADKAVDGCVDSDDPNNQECCCTSQPTQGQSENWWRVSLLQFYTIDYIIVIGRSGNYYRINRNFSKM